MVNVKRVRRLYRMAGFQSRNKSPRRKVAAKLRDDRCAATIRNECETMNFLSDELFDGGKICVLKVVDKLAR